MYLKIECLSDTCFAQPTPAEGAVDTDLAQDALGLPLPSGKTLHGLLRDMWQIAEPAWSAIDPQGVGESLLGKTRDHALGAVLRVGDASLSPTIRGWVAWAHDGRGRRNNDRKLPATAVPEAFLAERNLTAEDRQTGAPKAETLRRIRVIPHGTILTAPLTRLGAPFSPAQRQFLETLVALTRHAGLHRNRGLGHVRLSIDWEEDATPSAASVTPPTVPTGGMVFMPISLTLTAPCLIAHQELDENSIVTKHYLPGAALRGAVAAALERQGMAANMLADLIAGGRVRFLNAYPEGGDATKYRALPTPNTWRRTKDPTKKEDYDAEPRDETLSLLLPPSVAPDYAIEASDQRQPINTAFFALTPTQRYEPAEVHTRARTHQKRNSATGATSKSGDDSVFVYEALDAGQTFRGYVALTDASLWPNIQLVLAQESLLLGRSGRAGYGGLPKCEITSAKGEAHEAGGWAGDIPKNRCFTIRLTADAVLRDPETGQHDPHALKGALKRRFKGYADVLGATVATASIQGYNRLWRTELPAVPVAAMGSVALLEATCNITDNDRVKLQSEPLGERTLDGYGCFIVDRVFDETQEEMAISLALEPLPTPSPAPRPSGTVPQEVQDAQKRLYTLCLRRLLADAAIQATKNPAHLPPPSLIGRLRVPLRDAANWRQEWHQWLDESRDNPNKLRKEAADKLKECSLGNESLWKWMERMVADGNGWLKTLPGEAAERERHQMALQELAETIWEQARQEEALRLHYAGSVLSHLARKSAGREVSNP